MKKYSDSTRAEICAHRMGRLFEKNAIILDKFKSLLDYEGFLGRALPNEKKSAAAGLAAHVMGSEE